MLNVIAGKLWGQAEVMSRQKQRRIFEKKIEKFRP